MLYVLKEHAIFAFRSYYVLNRLLLSNTLTIND